MKDFVHDQTSKRESSCTLWPRVSCTSTPPRTIASDDVSPANSSCSLRWKPSSRSGSNPAAATSSRVRAHGQPALRLRGGHAGRRHATATPNCGSHAAWRSSSSSMQRGPHRASSPAGGRRSPCSSPLAVAAQRGVDRDLLARDELALEARRAHRAVRRPASGCAPVGRRPCRQLEHRVVGQVRDGALVADVDDERLVERRAPSRRWTRTARSACPPPPSRREVVSASALRPSGSPGPANIRGSMCFM